jgi:5-methylcytosine-specific restriction enzyme B
VNEVPPSILWPKNLFIAGTVNMDETTHPFSDKVLDRAFTFEFWDVDLVTYFDRRRQEDARHVSQIDDVYIFLRELNDKLSEVRRHVGYRAAGEVLDLLCAAAAQELLPDDGALWRLVDEAIYAKFLPRLRGHHSAGLSRALAIAMEACRNRTLDRCARKLQAMKNRLDDEGVTRFFA